MGGAGDREAKIAGMDIMDLKDETVMNGIDERGPLPWEKFFRMIETFSEGWLFRGARCASWALEISLERHTPKEEKLSKAEARLLRECEPEHDEPVSEDRSEGHARGAQDLREGQRYTNGRRGAEHSTGRRSEVIAVRVC